MTSSEFISLIKQRGAKIYPKSTDISLTMLNTNLQQLKICMTPNFLTDLYQQTSGITFSSACIFGPSEIDRGIKYPLPSILDINKEMIGNKNLYGKIIFGKNGSRLMRLVLVICLII